MSVDRLKIAAEILDQLLSLGWEPTDEQVRRMTKVVLAGGPSGGSSGPSAKAQGRKDRPVNVRRTAEVSPELAVSHVRSTYSPTRNDVAPCRNANEGALHRDETAGPLTAAGAMRGTRESGPSEAASPSLDPLLNLQSCKFAKIGAL